MFTESQSEDVRLSRPAEYPILRGPLGDLVLRPWFDGVALHGVARWYLPLSRAWAAALAAEGSVETLLDTLYPGRVPRAPARATARRLLDRAEARRADHARAARIWEEAFFGSEPISTDRLVTLERARHDAAHRLMGMRAFALPLHLTRRLPPVRWEVADQEAVERAHGHRLAAAEHSFPAPVHPAIERSAEIPGGYGREYWLRFASPVMDDTAWARVYEPEGVADAPSLIFLHGIHMEPEMWRDIADEISGLSRRGIRVIRPEGPWHGRRWRDGWFGGEPALGLGPLGFLDLLQAWVAEIAVLIGWARAQGRGPVAVGGVSLGALTSQLVPAAAWHWPVELCPDAVLLIANSEDLLQVAEAGSLARAVDLPRQFLDHGWTHKALQRWRPLLEPLGPPAVDPETVIMVLGSADDLVPVEGGHALVRRWRIPDGNVYLRKQGHFSVALGVGRDQTPLDHLARLLGANR